jgi:quercetin dioxygenase-like cupin family protein
MTAGATHVAEIGRGILPYGFRLHSAGKTSFVFREITLEAGASTGWHSHTGPLLVVVRSGSLTHDARGRATRTYGAGEAFIELPGAGNEHCGRNLGADPVKLEVLFIEGSETAPAEVLACSA